MTPILEPWQVALAVSLILVNGAVSMALRLGLERPLLIAAVRAPAQLILVGVVLNYVFAWRHWSGVALWCLGMTAVAGVSAVQRTRYRYPGIWLNGLVSISASAWLVTVLAAVVIVSADPWYHPRFVIPLLGMILGNALTGVSLGLDRLASELDQRRGEVESCLALGADRGEAALPAVQEAIRTGMVPIINTLSVVGLVSLPGMMTGQLLAGASPLEAAKYQIIILFLIAAATAGGASLAVGLGSRRLIDRWHRLRTADKRLHR